MTDIQTHSQTHTALNIAALSTPSIYESNTPQRDEGKIDMFLIIAWEIFNAFFNVQLGVLLSLLCFPAMDHNIKEKSSI